MCFEEELCVTLTVPYLHMKVQVRPWFLSDSEFYYDKAIPADPRKTVFIGGVPRPMKASELAEIMNERFGSVCYAAIDLDTDVNYPKGLQPFLLP